MNENELKDKIDQFLKMKKIEHPFLKECVTEFIEGHDKAFGHIISTDDLFKRLEENLDKITFKGKNGVTLGEYVKRDEEFEEQNEILIYADESDLEISGLEKNAFDIYTEKDKQEVLQKCNDRRNEIKNTVIHELTHAAYTKKMEYMVGDSHIFQDTVKDSFVEQGVSARKSKLLNVGKGHYVEGIVNYISSKINGSGETYKYQTEAIQLLADKIGEENLVIAAWESKEDIIKEEYISSIGKSKEEGEKSYSSFDESMRLLAVNQKEIDISRYNQRGKEGIDHIKKLLEGKTILSQKETILLKNERLESIKKIEPIEQENLKSGFEDVVNSDVSKSLINTVTKYVKEIYNKVMGKDNKENGMDR